MEPQLKISIQQDFFFAPKNRNTVVNKIFKNLTSAEKARVLENDLLGINCMIY